MHRLIGLLLGGLLEIVTTAVMAAPSESLTWKFSGFATLGAVSSRSQEAEFRANPQEYRGARQAPDVDVDSRLGLQESVQWGSDLSAVGQVLVSQREGREKPRIQWLFLQANTTPWLQLRAGRMVLPVFLLSDSRSVGYAAHWVRPPSEVYSLYPASTFDGAQAQARTDWAGTNLTLQASAGTTQVHVMSFGQAFLVDFKRLYSLNAVAERGSWTFRLGGTAAVQATLRGFAIPLAPFTDVFRGAGAIYDDGRLLVQAEYVTRRTSQGGFLDMDGDYLTAGYHVGSYTPYATYSHFRPRGSLLASLPHTRTVAAGVRLDAWRNVALKAQIESAQNNPFNFANEPVAFQQERHQVSVLTLLADVVF
jgi:hypothetical protein